MSLGPSQRPWVLRLSTVTSRSCKVVGVHGLTKVRCCVEHARARSTEPPRPGTQPCARGWSLQDRWPHRRLQAHVSRLNSVRAGAFADRDLRLQIYAHDLVAKIICAAGPGPAVVDPAVASE